MKNTDENAPSHTACTFHIVHCAHTFHIVYYVCIQKAMRENADFYQWMAARVRSCAPTIIAKGYFGGGTADQAPEK
jgi:hypothetical protein